MMTSKRIGVIRDVSIQPESPMNPLNVRFRNLFLVPVLAGAVNLIFPTKNGRAPVRCQFCFASNASGLT